MSGIEVEELSKRFGAVTAVDRVSFTVRAGEVTGFLGRNGAGKTTTLRMVLGLERPSSGSTTIDGRRYGELVDPLRQVGSLLDARAVRPGSTAEQHLRALARSNDIDTHRVDEVLRTVGLEDDGHRRTGEFSLGMLQRLGLAAALLGDPSVLVLDEPLNGLDPAGIIWFRCLVRRWAEEGRAVLLSSHIMTEMALSADRLLVIGQGRLLVDSDMATFRREHENEGMRVRTPDARTLGRELHAVGARVQDVDTGTLLVTGADGPTIGRLALGSGVEVDELTPVRRSLEAAFMELTEPAGQESALPGAGPSTGTGPTPDAAMSASVVPVRLQDRAGAGAGTDTDGGRAPARFRDIVASEFVKFRSTSTGPLLVAGTVVAGSGTAVLFANSVNQRYSDFAGDERLSFDPTLTSLRGRSIVQVTLGILGVLSMTSEFGTDTIVPSLAAVPDRPRLLAAKAVTTAGIGLATGLVTSTGAFLAGQALLGRHGSPSASLRSRDSARAVLGGALHASTAGLLGLGAGTLLRSSAGAVATIFGAEWLVPGIAPGLPAGLADAFARYWPTEAGARVLTARPDPDLLGPWSGLGVMAGPTAAVLVAALVAFHERDV